jgi:RND superfamily putative drug exporter
MADRGGDSHTGVFAGLGNLAARHPWIFFAVWAAIAILGGAGAGKAPALLFSGSGDIPASPSMRTDSLLRADFDNPYSQLLALAIRGYAESGSDSPESPQANLAARLDKALRALPQVRAVMTPDHVLDKRLLPAPGTGMLVLIGVKASNIRDAEQAIPVVRRVVDSVMEEELARIKALEKDSAPSGRADLRWAVTGRSALTYDLNLFNAKDTAEAEVRVIPLTLLILLFAFGSVVAAGVPVILGILSTTVSLGIVFLMARHWVFSNLIQNVSSMIGLAVGIDYSLIIIHRYREALASRILAAGRPGDRALRAEALAESMATAGKAVFYSGLAVMIGLGGMLFTPLMETKSIGWGGCIVVMVSVAAALTFLPALLVLLGPALDWPKALSSRFGGGRRGRRWEAWSRWVMKHAPLCAVLGLAAVAVMSLPGRYTRFGFPEGPFIPKELEFTRGYMMMDTMGMQGLVRPINIILTSKDGTPALTAAKVDSLYAFSARIRANPAVSRIFGPVDLADGWPVEKYRAFYGNTDADMDAAMERAPFLKEFFLAREGGSLLMQVMLKPSVGLEEEKLLAREIPGWLNLPGTTVDMGGQAVYYNDFDKAMSAAYLPCIAFVLAVTMIALLLFFRSPLVSLKAIVMNALSVLAGYGAVVWVFQLGHGHAFFGAPGPAEVVPLTIPIMLFCILFGLSMDYEVFLLSRMREGFMKSGDNERSVAEGLAATGPMITNAALIMAAVFGAFAFARVVVVQMLGLGLAVSVLVDATLIRILLVPAFMKMAGKWNWWPARRHP